MGMQGIDKYKIMLPVALDNGVSPVEAKEVLYQAVDYLGLGRVFPFFKATNDVLAVRGVEMPFPGQATTTMDKSSWKRWRDSNPLIWTSNEGIL